MNDPEYTVGDDLDAIDVHTHVLRSGSRPAGTTEPDPAVDFLGNVFNSALDKTLEEMISYYRERRMAFVAFAIDDPYRSGRQAAVSSEEIA